MLLYSALVLRYFSYSDLMSKLVYVGVGSVIQPSVKNTIIMLQFSWTASTYYFTYWKQPSKSFPPPMPVSLLIFLRYSYLSIVTEI